MRAIGLLEHFDDLWKSLLMSAEAEGLMVAGFAGRWFGRCQGIRSWRNSPPPGFLQYPNLLNPKEPAPVLMRDARDPPNHPECAHAACSGLPERRRILNNQTSTSS